MLSACHLHKLDIRLPSIIKQILSLGINNLVDLQSSDAWPIRRHWTSVQALQAALPTMPKAVKGSYPIYLYPSDSSRTTYTPGTFMLPLSKPSTSCPPLSPTSLSNTKLIPSPNRSPNRMRSLNKSHHPKNRLRSARLHRRRPR